MGPGREGGERDIEVIGEGDGGLFVVTDGKAHLLMGWLTGEMKGEQLLERRRAGRRRLLG